MPSSTSLLLSLAAAGGLALSGTPLCAADSHMVMIAICGEPGSRPLPIAPDHPGRDRDCPVACHAACPRKHGGEPESG